MEEDPTAHQRRSLAITKGPNLSEAGTTPKMESKESMKCFVCFGKDSSDDDDVLWRLECGHCFCSSCTEKVLNDKTECVICSLRGHSSSPEETIDLGEIIDSVNNFVIQPKPLKTIEHPRKSPVGASACYQKHFSVASSPGFSAIYWPQDDGEAVEEMEQTSLVEICKKVEYLQELRNEIKPLLKTSMETLFEQGMGHHSQNTMDTHLDVTRKMCEINDFIINLNRLKTDIIHSKSLQSLCDTVCSMKLLMLYIDQKSKRTKAFIRTLTVKHIESMNQPFRSSTLTSYSSQTQKNDTSKDLDRTTNNGKNAYPLSLCKNKSATEKGNSSTTLEKFCLQDSKFNFSQDFSVFSNKDKSQGKFCFKDSELYVSQDSKLFSFSGKNLERFCFNNGRFNFSQNSSVFSNWVKSPEKFSFPERTFDFSQNSNDVTYENLKHLRSLPVVHSNVKYRPTYVRGKGVKERIVSISVMKEYSCKMQEEIRSEHYVTNRQPIATYVKWQPTISFDVRKGKQSLEEHFVSSYSSKKCKKYQSRIHLRKAFFINKRKKLINTRPKNSEVTTGDIENNGIVSVCTQTKESSGESSSDKEHIRKVSVDTQTNLGVPSGDKEPSRKVSVETRVNSQQALSGGEHSRKLSVDNQIGNSVESSDKDSRKVSENTKGESLRESLGDGEHERKVSVETQTDSSGDKEPSRKVSVETQASSQETLSGGEHSRKLSVDNQIENAEESSSDKEVNRKVSEDTPVKI